VKRHWMTVTLLALSVGLGLGCNKSKDMGRVRPPVDELAEGGRGLQGKDVITASDKMASSLLSLPALGASQTQWTIVVDRIENLSVSQREDMNIFLRRLRTQLINKGQGRVTLVENLQKFNELKSRELEPGTDKFGQGGVGSPTKNVQPDYFLSARLSELPNRETSYFLVDFTLTKVDRTIVWGDMYEIATTR
jgi:hypothetical protein